MDVPVTMQRYGGVYGVGAVMNGGLERPFFSPQALTVVSAPGLQGCPSRRESDSRVTRHQFPVSCIINAAVLST